MRRRWVGRTVATLVLVAGIAIAFLSGRVTSPEQVVDSATPPDPGPVEVQVETRVLRDSVVGRAVVEPLGSESVALETTPTDGRAVVTGVAVTPGSDLENGNQVVEVAGRPVFVLDTTFGPYRDIGYGTEGPDVAELQAALGRLGFSVPDSGEMDDRTTRALAKFYENRGYDVPRQAPALPAADGEETSPEPAGTSAPAPASTPYLPMSEWIAVPALPKRIDAVDVTLGQDIGENPASLELSSAGRGLRARLDPAVLDALQPDQPVVFTPDGAGASGESIELTLREIVPLPSAEEKGAQAEGALLRVDGDGLGDLPLGTPGRLEAILVQTEEVLAVPAEALAAGPDGAPHLETPAGDHIEVRVGRAAAGWVEVHGDGLRDGLTVVVP